MKKVLMLILFISFQSLASHPVSLKSPRETMNSFLKNMKLYKLGESTAILKAIKTLDLSQFDEATKKTSALVAAQKLIQTLDRIEYIDIKTIPKELNSDTWIFRKESVVVDGQKHNVEISIGKINKTDWKFSAKTLSSIILYERAIKHKKIVKGAVALSNWRERIKTSMPAWTAKKTLFLLRGQWLSLFILIVGGFLLTKLFLIYIKWISFRIIRKFSPDFQQKKINHFVLPLGLAFFALIWMSGIQNFEFTDKLLSIFHRGGIIFLTTSLVFMVYNIVGVLGLYLDKFAKESANQVDDILAPLITKSLKTLVFIVGFILIGDSLTLDMKNIIAGLGIGGIAFALAAKDTISNIFGSLTVILDRPFQIGDWIKIGNEIEGMVEDVGLRSTRIRTFYDSQITFPNGILTNSQIDNFGRRHYRRYSSKVGIQYDTPAKKVEAFCEGIRQLIQNHPHTRKDNFHVYLNGLGDSSLEIMLYVFWAVPNWSTELQEKHRLLLDILRLGKEMKIEFAFPTQTLHVHQESSGSDQNIEDDFFKVAKDHAKGLSENSLTPLEPRSSAPLKELTD